MPSFFSGLIHPRLAANTEPILVIRDGRILMQSVYYPLQPR